MKPLIRAIEFLKFQGFWAIDFIRGSKVRKHLKDIKTIIESKDKMQVDSIRKNHLEALLQHAVKTTEFYNCFNPDDGLASFPVINKNTINKNPAHFHSSLFTKNKNKKVTTSGSTGALLTITHNRNKNYRNTADNIYFSKLAGFQVGYKLFYLRHWSCYFKKNKWVLYFQNMYPIEVVGLSDKKIEALIRYIKKDASKKSWLGYASGFERICQYMDTMNSKPLDAGFKSIIAISEHLSEQTRQRMAYYFKTPVVSRYSNMENGIIAQQPLLTPSFFIINRASYHVEIFNLENDNPGNLGQLGRIVVTDFFNYATPLIRYDTGDLGVLDCINDIAVLKRIEGRTADSVFNTNGELVSSFMIIDACNFKGILQIQLIQRSKFRYTIKLNVSKTFTKSKELMANFKSYLGNEAIINIEYVEEIPILASGKRKITINNFKSSGNA